MNASYLEQANHLLEIYKTPFIRTLYPFAIVVEVLEDAKCNAVNKVANTCSSLLDSLRVYNSDDPLPNAHILEEQKEEAIDFVQSVHRICTV